jgi:hypothetical protein
MIDQSRFYPTELTGDKGSENRLVIHSTVSIFICVMSNLSSWEETVKFLTLHISFSLALSW